MAGKAKKLQTQEEREEAIKKALDAIEKETSDIKEDVEKIEEDIASKDNKKDKEEDVSEERIEENLEVDDGETEEVKEVDKKKGEDDEKDEDKEEESDLDDKKDNDTEDIEEDMKETSEKEKSDEEEGQQLREEVESSEESNDNKIEESREKDTDDKSSSSFGPMEEDKNQNSLLWKFVYVVAFLVGVGGAILIYQVTSSGQTQEQQVTQEEPSPTATPVPTQAIELSDYGVTVQNGSGEAGVAAAGQELLEDEDFEVIDTGNADSFDYEETVISAGEDVPEEVIETLRKALEAEYIVAEDSEEYDISDEILVIIGSETN